MFRLSLDCREKFWSSGIDRAGEHKILPDEQSLFVAKVIEIFHFIDSPSPDADHVHVRLFGARQQIVIVRAGDATDKAMRGNPIRALGEYRSAVYHKLKGLAEFIGMAIEHDRSKSHASTPAIEDFLAIDKLETHIVKGMSPLAVRPPQFRILDLKFEIGDFSDDLGRSRDDAA